MKNNVNNEKYQNVLLMAKKLFWKHGIRRITVEEICKEAKVSKMMFYRFFENKKQLAEFVLKNILDEGYIRYRHIMELQVPFSEKIKQLVILKHELSIGLSEEFLKDVYQSEDKNLLQLLNDYKEKTSLEFKEDLKTAQKEGCIRKDMNIEFISYMLDIIGEQVFDKNLNVMYSDKHNLIMELTNLFFYGISQNPE